MKAPAFVPHLRSIGAGKRAARLVFLSMPLALLWLAGCQLPRVVKESAPSPSSPSVGAGLTEDWGGAAGSPVKATPDPNTPGLQRFSHEQHVTENELECAVCHEIGESGRPKMPDHEVCSGCHDINETEPSADCLTCHVLSQQQVQDEAFADIAVRRVPEQGEFQFNHSSFAGEPGVCANCHKQAPGSLVATDNLRGDHGSLFPALREKGFDTKNCTTCHVSMGKNTPPPSHSNPGFLQHHGAEYRTMGSSYCMTCQVEKQCQTCHEQTQPTSHLRPEWTRSHGKMGQVDEEKCQMCHNEQSCKICHSSQMPQDHTNFFRRRSHGNIAAINRDRCLVCHKQDYCQACHIGAAPLMTPQPFHVAGAACLACHSPASAVRPLRRHGPLPQASCLNCHRFQ